MLFILAVILTPFFMLRKSDAVEDNIARLMIPKRPVLTAGALFIMLIGQPTAMDTCDEERAGSLRGDAEHFRHHFNAALGSGHPGAEPELRAAESLEFTPKVKL